MVFLASLRAYRRFFVVAWHFLPLLLSYARDRNRFFIFGRSRQVDSKTRIERADTLLESLLTLGPTFIKLGQLLSTRPDILPPEYVEELSKLQDEVPPAEWERARKVLESEIGPVEEKFAEFDTEAISGASLGQVYAAQINGEKVAVKVRRPGIEDLVEADLRVIRWSLPILMRFIGQGRAFSLENLADEFARTIREEMDYGREASMLREIRSNFEDEDGIAIPRVIDSHSGSRVLTMKYIGGTKINRVDELDDKNIDRHELAVTLQRAYLQMIIEDGVFHADPHPGNLAVKDDGTIVFYDFGMSGRADEFIQRKIVDFYIAVANQDIDGILDALIEMGTLSPEADRATMGKVMELAIEDARGEDIETYRVQQIVEQVEDTIYEFPLRLPSNLALVLRVATVVEGVCVTLDPEFDFISVATEYLTEEGYREESIKQYVSETGDQLQASAQSIIRTPPKLERTLDRIDRDDFYARVSIEDDNDVFDLLAKRLIYGILLAFGGLTTAVLYAAEAVPAAGISGAISLFVVGLLYRSFRKRKGIRTTPQFTRQNLRDRRGGK
ncbi:Predicted unusual protein kinase regulating ubiquinone biosynthesis, AarF/ABC1/UbiB family [Haladaptatus litoreus]|uniref:Predicted unusual protein kinase regulating ubiquinone biosynthesis, AarF/ABC1/UbiB family n=1 Tax=Haladaptatus litoreus TaxID=553468 RepID=A0A1N6ZFN5_9EURY|nr:AarF/ABC1/UbiB kinase family protein [Haladaptatus litoreus]SIR25629.1 Predicted unusual protein kinase regulating ubiquinone biosynthesis, AarF/ABC1/UbiB family [Haladaptatus litoreus]